MNKQEFTATGSYPLSTQTMALLQESIATVAELSRIGGANYILSGCTQTGNSVTEGIIVINGEPMPFAGGAALATITVVETPEDIMANGTEYKNARIKRQAQFATGSSASYLPWANFKPLPTNQQLDNTKAALSFVNTEIKRLTDNSVPKGAIVMWSGSISAIPKGWTLCDGSIVSGVQIPNLKGRFIVGYDPNDNDYNVVSPYESNAKRGGGKTVKLTIDEMPSHTHTVHLTADDHQLDDVSKFGVFETNQSEVGSLDFGLNPAGGNQPHENRPPYYVLAYIMKVI